MKPNSELEVRSELVDNHNGIYCWHSLADRYPLFKKNKSGYYELSSRLMKKRFHPDNEQWCDEVDHYDSNGLYVQNDNGSYWMVQQDDGDIWAINPLAVWIEDEEEYQMPKEVEVSLDVSITIKVPADVDPEDFLSEMDYNFKSTTEGASVIETEIQGWDIRK